jgi:tetratricopeptide (TPR) repeat protein
VKLQTCHQRIGLNNLARRLVLTILLLGATAASAHTRAVKPCDSSVVNNHGPDEVISGANEEIALYDHCSSDRWSYCARDLVHDYTDRAEAYCAKGQTAQALADANRAINLLESGRMREEDKLWQTFAYTTRADIRVNLGQFDQAIADYAKSLKIEDNFVLQFKLSDAYFDQAEFFLNKRNYRDAIGAYDGIIRTLNPAPGGDSRGPHDDERVLAWLIEAYAGKIHAYEALGDLDNAEAVYTALIGVDDKDADAHFARGRMRLARGNAKGALEDFTAAVDDFPTEPEYRLARGKTYLALGNADAALADFDAAIARAPDAGSYLLRAQARRGKGDLAGALADLNEAVSRDGTLTSAYVDRGFVKAATRDLDGALADLDAAIRLDGNSPAYFTMRGALLGIKGNFGKAIADYGSAIALDPQDAQTYTMRAWALLKAGKLPDGLDDANRAVALERESVGALVTRGHIFEAMGRRT